MRLQSILAGLLFFLGILSPPAIDGMTPEENTQEVPRTIAPVNAPFEMPDLQRPEFPDQTFNIANYGAKPGAGHKNTKAIHRAIEAAHHAGGGKVLIPAGEWWTGPIHLRSNINLHISKDAEVHFSKEKEDYLPVVIQRHEGVIAYNYSPLIYANDVKNVALTGQGILNGHGQHWWDWDEEHEGQITERTEATKVPLSRRMYGKGAGQEGMRPPFVSFWKSENILVEGVTLKDTPFWNVVPVFSKNIIVRGITVLSKEAPNGDGINPSSCKNVLIEYNHFETGDDAVVLKSGLNEEGLKIDIPTQNVVVRNYKAVNVQTGSGGIVFGSETSGGIKNVYVHDAYFEGCDRGIRFKSERGRGNVVENIYIHDIEMKDMDESAINFNTYYHQDARGPAPLFKNIHIWDIKIDGVPNAIIMNGLPEKWLENFTLKNIDVRNAKYGAQIHRVKNLILENISIRSEERALEATDVFEFTIRNLTLSNEIDALPFYLGGSYTGAVKIDGYPSGEIEKGEDLPENAME